MLLNPHLLSLLKTKARHGRKLLMKYDGPFEIIQKLSAVFYRLRMPEYVLQNLLWNGLIFVSKYKIF